MDSLLRSPTVRWGLSEVGSETLRRSSHSTPSLQLTSKLLSHHEMHRLFQLSFITLRNHGCQCWFCLFHLSHFSLLQFLIVARLAFAKVQCSITFAEFCVLTAEYRPGLPVVQWVKNIALGCALPTPPLARSD